MAPVSNLDELFYVTKEGYPRVDRTKWIEYRKEELQTLLATNQMPDQTANLELALKMFQNGELPRNGDIYHCVFIQGGIERDHAKVDLLKPFWTEVCILS